MSQQDKPQAEVSLDKVFSRIVSEYESGNLEKINLQIDLGLKNPKYDKLEAALKEAVEALELIGASRALNGDDTASASHARKILERIRKVSE